MLDTRHDNPYQAPTTELKATDDISQQWRLFKILRDISKCLLFGVIAFLLPILASTVGFAIHRMLFHTKYQFSHTQVPTILAGSAAVGAVAALITVPIALHRTCGSKKSWKGE